MYCGKYTIFSIILSVTFIFTGSLSAQTVNVSKLTQQPTVDGLDEDWKSVEETIIPVKKSGENVTVEIDSVSIRAGIYGDEVFLFIHWQDSTRDTEHKPFEWDTAQNKYIAGKQREDRFALQFEMSGDYTVDWLSGKSFTADTWHWKAARTNPLDLMHDKMTIIGTEPVKKAYKATAQNGSTLYIQRPGDQGDKLYTTKRYSSKIKETMPKYILADTPGGSVTDVYCKGVWKDGAWHLEIRRKMNTGHPDDVVFAEGSTIRAGLAVFDHTGDDNHVISDTFSFQF